MTKETTDIVIREVPAQSRRRGRRRTTRLDRELITIYANIPIKLNKKLDAYTTNLTARCGKRVTKLEVVMIAIALLIKGEHLLEDYYKVKQTAPPKRFVPKIKARKSQLNEILDKAIQEARLRSVGNDDINLQEM